METILIATDFSSAAQNATRYGFELSKAMNAKVILFNAFQYKAGQQDNPVSIPVSEMEKEAYGRLAIEAEKIDPGATVRLETLCSIGPVSDSIIAAATDNMASFIIIGMKRTGVEFRKYFGSTVTALSKESGIPMIVVPEEASYKNLDTIVFGIDAQPTNIHVLDPLKKLVSVFNASISIVRVIKKSSDEGVEKHFVSAKLDAYLAPYKHSFDFIKDENIAKAINLYVKQNANDMIVVIPHKHNIVDRLFTRSITKDLIFHSHVPLLILPSEISEQQEICEEEYYSPYYESVY